MTRDLRCASHLPTKASQNGIGKIPLWRLNAQMNRRTFIATAIAGVAAGQVAEPPPAITSLKPMLDGIQPITDAERAARVEKARSLMHDQNLGAVYIESGTSMFYFAGKRQPGKAWILPRKGEPAWIDADGAQAARALKDMGVATGRIGLEEQVRFATFDGLRKEAPAVECASATPVTAGCRMIKSPAELALMQRANDITIAAYKAVLSSLREGMTERELSAWISAAYRALGVGGAAMASFGKYTAFPHGSIEPQKLREGDVVLIDDGCSVEGYQSDITRTTVFGKPNKRQTEIWNLERKAQDAALAAARVGAACE